MFCVYLQIFIIIYLQYINIDIYILMVDALRLSKTIFTARFYLMYHQRFFFTCPGVPCLHLILCQRPNIPELFTTILKKRNILWKIVTPSAGTDLQTGVFNLSLSSIYISFKRFWRTLLQYILQRKCIGLFISLDKKLIWVSCHPLAVNFIFSLFNLRHLYLLALFFYN